MKKAVVISLALAVASSVVSAGGMPEAGAPDVIVEEKAPSSSGALIPLLLLALIGIAVAGGNDGPVNCGIPN